jgi:hypothetical protein
MRIVRLAILGLAIAQPLTAVAQDARVRMTSDPDIRFVLGNIEFILRIS